MYVTLVKDDPYLREEGLNCSHYTVKCDLQVAVSKPASHCTVCVVIFIIQVEMMCYLQTNNPTKAKRDSLRLLDIIVSGEVWGTLSLRPR